jgi:hypothetical protein
MRGHAGARTDIRYVAARRQGGECDAKSGGTVCLTSTTDDRHITWGWPLRRLRRPAVMGAERRFYTESGRPAGHTPLGRGVASLGRFLTPHVGHPWR